jgi:hypothetical protein
MIEDHITGLIIVESRETGAEYINDINAGSPP